MKLHHCAFNIVVGSSQLVQGIFEHLGGKLVWEGKDQGREIAISIDGFVIQISEINDKPTRNKNKVETHIAFRSEDPVKEIYELKKWIEKKGVKVVVGKWKESELWLDLPDIFINFVVEIFNN